MSDSESSSGQDPKAQRPRQNWLLEYQNPLKKRFGSEFFSAIPKNPGVYWMLNSAKKILYVGKAKNLRNRLRSYQTAKPGQSPRKTIRLIRRVVEIHWEECDSERTALLRENALLREHRPPFNVMNTRPESYYFVGFSSTPVSFRFRLTTQQTSIAPEGTTAATQGKRKRRKKKEEVPANEQLYGVFRSRGLTRQGFASLLRLLWAVLTDEGESPRFEFPGVLVRQKGPLEYNIWVKETLGADQRAQWLKVIGEYFSGSSKDLLAELTESLLSKETIPPFYYHFIQDDLKTLERFYEYGPYRNKSLNRQGGIESALLPQEMIDDLLVQLRYPLP